MEVVLGDDGRIRVVVEEDSHVVVVGVVHYVQIVVVLVVIYMWKTVVMVVVVMVDVDVDEEQIVVVKLLRIVLLPE